MVLYENGRVVAHPRTLREAKAVVAGLDESMAVVDCAPQEYTLFKGNKQIWNRPRIRVP